MTNANDQYSAYHGTENYYKHFLGYYYTDGVKQLASDCQAYWLIDLIISHQLHKKVNKHPFQVWKLNRIQEDCFQITADDSNGHTIITQDIPFSDFPHDTATIWLSDNILLLPSEY